VYYNEERFKHKLQLLIRLLGTFNCLQRFVFVTTAVGH